jgi:AraC-like DNA-binding protein
MRDFLSQIDVSVGEVTYPPGGTLGPRVQHDVQLVLVHAGSARIDVDGEERLLRSGEVGLLLPGHTETFAFDPRVATRHSWVQLRAVPRPGLPVSLPLSPALDDLVRDAVRSAAEGLGDALVAHLAAAAILRYAGEAARGRPERPSPVADAQRFVAAHLADPGLDLARIAAAAHVTPAHLVRAFRVAAGTTPVAYLWERRTMLAVELLVNTGLPIGAVADRAGFATVQHLSRRVKAATGLPPAALRRERWAG